MAQLTLTDDEVALILEIRSQREKVYEKEGVDGYAQCVEAMADGALAAFNFLARELGVTGWQASMAELLFLQRSRRIDGPFGIYTMADALFPQYDLFERLDSMRWSDETVKWLGDCAEYALAEKDYAVPEVREHWERLVAQRDLRAQVK